MLWAIFYTGRLWVRTACCRFAADVLPSDLRRQLL